ncbi:hypothetical protein QO010_000221 [Caulobacter ginsengisoli]|uniref:Secreted protein n=1 Tax=Caulobacter ginsengisoli TaxID=400775 RepID=A0ABU0IKD9_9CAUL|nr:hypothetical protein [Caulobacter ginsengisoli]MDQ0462473.1 hypothetical protein [Caulobacter ginsengisoli]
MRRVVLMAVAASLLTVSAALADQPASSPTAPSAPAAPATPGAKPKVDMNDPNRIVCTREHVVGSNRPQKICMTVAERQRLKDQADRDMDISKHNIDVNLKATGGDN